MIIGRSFLTSILVTTGAAIWSSSKKSNFIEELMSKQPVSTLCRVGGGDGGGGELDRIPESTMRLQSGGGHRGKPTACLVLRVLPPKCSALAYIPASGAISLLFENAIKRGGYYVSTTLCLTFRPAWVVWGERPTRLGRSGRSGRPSKSRQDMARLG